MTIQKKIKPEPTSEVADAKERRRIAKSLGRLIALYHRDIEDSDPPLRPAGAEDIKTEEAPMGN